MSKKMNIILAILGGIYAMALIFPLIKSVFKGNPDFEPIKENNGWVEEPLLIEK